MFFIAQDYDLSALGCSDAVSERIMKNTGSCSGGGQLNVIGFDIATTGGFYELIEVCFDSQEETTLYTKHTLHGANIAAKDVEEGRPSFKTDSGFFSVSMNTVYAQASQLELMTTLLGDAANLLYNNSHTPVSKLWDSVHRLPFSALLNNAIPTGNYEDLANQIIDPSQQLYFAKGHMSPDADFVTIAEQDATYYFINALPQWQAFNNGNWKVNISFCNKVR
ncbi:hypothetical protein SK128_010671 [Halocaridina rubra]|uniref:DNA/RNA non-specific endonuclease/pyrophosphatase/phosphodiesterase domain-containing protein n=1 Tax=Halocaridina rubra TaxID=373956 RepID=A0AAN8WB07_HALRR